MSKPKLIIACSGAGRVLRGFELFSEELFQQLSKNEQLDVWFCKGAGSTSARELVPMSFFRQNSIACFLSLLTRRHPYSIEQISFAFGMLPMLLRIQPDVILFSDGTLGNVLWHFRMRLHLHFKLIFSNGAPLNPPFSRCDWVHQVTESARAKAIAASYPDERQTLIPYGVSFTNDDISASVEQIRELRERFYLPIARKIIICVAAINRWHKRIDYLIDELGLVSAERPFLLLIGQHEAESEEVLALARAKLGIDGFVHRQVDPAQMSDYYKCADIFVLPSLSEGFGRVIVEAARAGLPCALHDCPTTREILGEIGFYADFQKQSALSELLSLQMSAQSDSATKLRRRNFVAERFSWEVLQKQYISMVDRVCQE